MISKAGRNVRVRGGQGPLFRGLEPLLPSVQSIQPGLCLLRLTYRIRPDRPTRCEEFLLKLEGLHAELLPHLVDRLTDFSQIFDDGGHSFARHTVCIMIKKTPSA